ncbi:hypothetical protein [Stieleria mannarensis]|uniref:hypothetical protein n=1 Tax=Stieleria mannarensis TaxID=2755585 RepID=UPI001601040E|nr:hypothetical protein [Rhodopirellula sp. JC639]
MILSLVSTPSSAQSPEPIAFSGQNATVTLSNFRWLTAQKFKSQRGIYFGEPIDPQPLNSSRLYPPRTYIYLFFDYRVYRDNPRGAKSKLFVRLNEEGQVAGKPRPLGNKRFEIAGNEGTGFIGFGYGAGAGVPRVDGNLEFSIDVYTEQANEKELVIGKSDKNLKVTFSIDGEAIISESQLEAIKSMYRRLEQLEKRAKTLESRE